MGVILEAQKLVKKYGDFYAVNGVSFSVEEGEIFGFLGPNGAGKTQTISMLTGVIEPTSGTARIGGYDIRTQMAEAKKLNGLVPQDLALYPTLSARANLNFFGRVYGLTGQALKEQVADVLHIVALTERADQPVETFSGGMKRRVNIAAGLIHKPRLLFLDEPTVGVDPQSRNHIFESVLQLNRERGMSIVYTSHYMEEVETLCNRVAIIDRGKIIALDTVKSLLAIMGEGLLQIGLKDVDEQLLADLSALPAVRSAVAGQPPSAAVPEDGEPTSEVPAAGGNEVIVRIQVDDSRAAMVSVFGYLNERDINFSSVDILEPNLESVFLHLTGKKLRE